MPTKLLISDANILIDMDVGGLLESMFELEFDFAVPDVLFEEELRSQHANLPDLGLLVLELTGESIEYAFELAGRYPHPSRNDLLALCLARQEACPLLTGDASLRTACDSEGVDVHGTVWLIERLFDANLIDAAAAEQAYDAMYEDGSRLPGKRSKRSSLDSGGEEKECAAGARLPLRTPPSTPPSTAG